MRQSRFREEQIAAILKEGNEGTDLPNICDKYHISPGTYYKWRAKYGNANARELKRLRKMEKLYRLWKSLYAKARTENQILQEAIAGKL
jgi:putative transposase